MSVVQRSGTPRIVPFLTTVCPVSFPAKPNYNAVAPQRGAKPLTRTSARCTSTLPLL
jgi:hypothetical protein